MMHLEDLRVIAEPWYDLTAAMMGAVDYGSPFGWIIEMWAFIIACGDSGLIWTERHWANHSLECIVDAPLIHYCYPGENFDKRSYRPGSHVTETGPYALQVVLRELNEFTSRVD